MDFLPILLTVNLLLAVAQAFHLGMSWERHRVAALAPAKESYEPR